MFVVEKLRKNPFKVAFLPSPKDLFLRVGSRPAGGAYSGSDPDNLRTIAMSVRKLDSIAIMDSMDTHDMYQESRTARVESEQAQPESEPQEQSA